MSRFPSSDALLVLGYSGGGDSTALLLELAAGGRPLVAVIVDHALRDGSATDAARAAAIARAAGVDAEIVTLAWPDGVRPAQQAARAARMVALAAQARRLGAATIALAHTRDDQAETVLIRLAAGSSWMGLAGMQALSAAPLWPEGRGLTVMRPLLGVRRAALRARLKNLGASWIEDPANTQARFTRVRARQRLEAWENSDLGVERWAALADRLARRRLALDKAAAALIDAAVRFEGPAALADGEAFAGSMPAVRRRAASVLIAAAGAAARVPADDALDRLLDAKDGARTLGGARVRLRGGQIEFGRDRGAVTGRAGATGLGPAALNPGEEIVWDGRVSLAAVEPGWRAEPAPDGQEPVFRRGNDLESLADACGRGAILAKWLIQERIAHLLWR